MTPRGNDKILGPEPVSFDPPLESENDFRLVETYNWYNYFYDVPSGREWLYEWMTKKGYSDKHVDRVKQTAAYYTPLHISVNARIELNGNVLPPVLERRIRYNINECLLMDLPEDKIAWGSQRQSKDHAKMKAVQAEFEEEIEKFWLSDYTAVPTLNWFEVLKESGIKKTFCAELVEPFEALQVFIKTADHINGLKKERYLGVVGGVVDAINAYASTGVAKTRKPRQKRPVDASKLVAKLQHLWAFPELGLISVEAVKLVGAKAAVLYSTKYRKLTYLVGKNEGLTVKGTTILNFDEKQSQAKRLRKPETTLPTILNRGPKEIPQILDSLSTKPIDVNGRCNGDDTIILRVIR